MGATTVHFYFLTLALRSQRTGFKKKSLACHMILNYLFSIKVKENLIEMFSYGSIKINFEAASLGTFWHLTQK